MVCLFKILIKENNKSERKLTFFNFSVDVKKIKCIYCIGAVCRIYELDISAKVHILLQLLNVLLLLNLNHYFSKNF